MVLMKLRVPARGRSVLGLGVIVALLGASCGSSAQLGAKALLEQSKTLRSEAAEGALLSEDAVSGKATSNYIHEHAVELSQAASQIEATLQAASTDPSLEPERGQLVVLARRISDDLQRLSEASIDEQGTLTSELQAAADASQRIGEGLT
jgi:3-oxoacyl-ACP reductase-like protein